ncbi:Delta(24(24(1)))-sterol reductase like protein [Coniochaeta sp. 2T2.1]|nr:Delta(24(24(1)))-sterol reductase like protein [Coniochaeta sp. 2T2.1]
MSARYSLRQTPKKKTLFDGMIQTPAGRPSRSRKSLLPIDGSDADGDSSSATESTRSKPVRRRAKFVEHIDEDDVSTVSTPPTSSPEQDTPEPIVRPDVPNGAAKTAKSAKVHIKQEEAIDGWAPGMDPKIDYSGEKEFGGAWGTGAMMIGFPILMWYMWIGATYYNGGVPTREPGQSWSDFGAHLVDLVYTGAYPHAKAWAMYWIFFIFEGACYCLLPGVWCYGKPLPHMGGKQLPYYCSAVSAFYTTAAVAAILHTTGLFKLYTIIDEFGPLLSVAIMSGFIVSIIAYISAFARGATHRMTGNHIYDFFMGAELNPRMFGILDFKMFFEVRLPWYILFLLSLGTAARQYERYGYVSGEVCFMVMAHYLYANACSKGEELITPTWDMYYEKWGFMLIFWNLAGVPLTYCHAIIYLANHHPDEYRKNPYLLGAMFVGYLFVYWVWDSCNSQKNRFRSMERGVMVQRKSFPQVPWQTIHNPKKIETSTGDAILVDGWYGLARKVHYTCDAYFALNWGLITGFRSPYPWFYPLFFTCMIAHRAWRDVSRCRAKYGEAWLEYERRVPYLFIPYVI